MFYRFFYFRKYMVETEDNNTISYSHIGEGKFRFLHYFKLWSKRLVILASLIQLFYFPTLENIIAVLSILVGWLCNDLLILNRYTINRFVFLSFIVISYSITQFFIPIVFTLLEGKPLMHNLKYPYSVNNALFACIIYTSIGTLSVWINLCKRIISLRK